MTCLHQPGNKHNLKNRFSFSGYHIFIRYILCSLVGLHFFACEPYKTEYSTVIWDKGKATAISFPAEIIKDLPRDSVAQLMQVKLKGQNGTAAILGELTVADHVIFKPLLPFSRGTQYEVFIRGIKKDSFSIAFADTTDAPALLSIYPTLDTLPENLLKIYFQFSHPMQEAVSPRFIKLVRNGSDTLRDAFLDLQPELWNTDRTVLTMWLDPGRIKRDLQPNLRLGAPLKKNDKYTLIVAQQWKDGNRVPLPKNYSHSFVTMGRDSIGPDPYVWKIRDSIIDQKKAFAINLGGSLDHFLLPECLSVTDEKGNKLKGSFVSYNKDSQCYFNPQLSMPPGKYILQVASKLEDLAGNNLNRPFDRDVTNSKTPSTATEYILKFTIR